MRKRSSIYSFVESILKSYTCIQVFQNKSLLHFLALKDSVESKSFHEQCLYKVAELTLFL